MGWEVNEDFLYVDRGPGLRFFRCRVCGHQLPAVKKAGSWRRGERWRYLLNHTLTHVEGVEVRWAA